jgi:acyl-CoA thioester hydrolase
VIPAGARRTVVHLRVRFGETDAMGVANNAGYLSWFEVGRVEYLRELGHSYADVHAGGMDMVVVEAHAEYLRALRFDDEFAVECACTEVRGATFTFSYEITRNDALVCRGHTRHACVDRASMRPVRVPGWLHDAVSRGAAT